jgi:hypothetical protein
MAFKAKRESGPCTKCGKTIHVAYFKALKADVYVSPERYELSYMGAQAVRMNIDEILAS